jgi:hypothetical protein
MKPSSISIFIIVATLMVVPLYINITFPQDVAIMLNSIILIWGSIVLALTYYEIQLSVWLVPCIWMIVIVLSIIFRKHITLKSQKMLVGLQIFRAIGVIFLIETMRNRVSSLFAYPAGIGDLLVSALAICALIASFGREDIPHTWVLIVLIIGIIDFVVAMVFGVLSRNHSNNKILSFPTGVIPLLLVPIALMFHVASAASLVAHKT